MTAKAKLAMAVIHSVIDGIVDACREKKDEGRKRYNQERVIRSFPFSPKIKSKNDSGTTIDDYPVGFF